VALPAGTRVVQVTVGSGHMLALTSTGEVYGWGDNAGGDLGQGGADTTERNTPVPIAFPEGTVIVSLDAGNGVSYAVTSTGEVYAWGGNSSGELGDGSKDSSAHATPQLVPGLSGVKEVSTNDAAPFAFTLALTDSGEVYAWGSELGGQLGNGVESDTEYVLAPTAVSGLASVAQIATGGEYGLAAMDSGSVEGWGYDYCGELGNGGTGCSGPGIEKTPVSVPFPAGEDITSVAAASVGPGHSLAASSTGVLYGWGGSEHSPTVIAVPGGAAVSQVAAGPDCDFALTGGGLLYADGGSSGECGYGAQGSSFVSPLLEVQAPSGTKVVQVDGGGEAGALICASLVGTAPTVSGVSPPSGPAAGGNTVTVQGSGFARGAVVTFGSQVATNVSVGSSKLLTVTAPAGSGTVDVAVTVEGSTSPVTSADRYTFEAAASGNGGGAGGSGGGGSGGTGGSGGAQGGASQAQIVAALTSHLVPSGGAARIVNLLKQGSFPFAFDAPEGGTATVAWYEVPSGAHLAKKRSLKPILIASGQHTFSSAGTARIAVRLTAAGKRLLKHSTRLKLTTKGTFTPAGRSPVSVERAVVLTR
jgi:alpha-tubulin suppressor-like RCC1 family protein